MPATPALSYMGLDREATWGEGAVPTAFLPLKAQPTVGRMVNQIDDLGMRGSMVEIYDKLPGRKHSTYSATGDVYADTFPHLGLAMLGAITTTGASAPFSHAIALLNTGASGGQPPSYSVSDFDGFNTQRIPGLRVNELTLRFNADGLLEWEIAGTGKIPATVANPTQAYGTLDPMQVWRGVVTLGGTANARLQNGELRFRRSLEVVPNIANSQDPADIRVGPLNVDGQLTFIYDVTTEIDHYLTDAEPKLVLDWSRGAAGTLEQIKVESEKTKFTTGVPDRGSIYAKLTCDIFCRPDSANASAAGGNGLAPAKITVQNAMAAATYT